MDTVHDATHWCVEAQWVFVEDAELSATLDRNNVDYQTGTASGDVTAEGSFDLTGVLLGNLAAEV